MLEEACVLRGSGGLSRSVRVISKVTIVVIFTYTPKLRYLQPLLSNLQVESQETPFLFRDSEAFHCV